MANEFVARNGFVALKTSTVSGSFNQGFSVSATGTGSHAEGEGSLAKGDYSHAEGNYTLASGSHSHAEGNQTVAQGQYSHAEGQDTKAIGEASHAEGNFNFASGSFSHAEGEGSYAYGYASHAEGSSVARESYAHSEGTATAIGYASHAENGAYTSASFAHAEGSGTAIAPYSHAEGVNTIASGTGSHAGGFFTEAAGDYQTVIGTFNTADATSLFIIGNGTGSLDRRNLALFRTSSIIFNAPLVIVGGITASLSGTASWAQNSISSSYSVTSTSSSYSAISLSSSYSLIALSSSYSLTATSSSYSLTAVSASHAPNIFNSNGTLTSARTVTLSGNPLDIIGSTTTRFFSNGRVGINTTTDGGFQLDVNGTTRIQGNFLVSPGTVIITGSGNGIYSNSTAYAFQIITPQTTQGNLILGAIGTPGANTGAYLVFRQADGTFPTPSTTATDRFVSQQDHQSYNGSAYVTGVSIRAVADGRLLFGTTPSYGGTLTYYGKIDKGRWFFGNMTSNGNTARDQAISAAVQIRGLGTTATTNALRVENISGSALAQINDAGTLGITGSLHVSGSATIGSGSAVPTSAFTVHSTTQGMIFPRMSTTQRTSISTPEEGLMVYDLTTHSPWYFNGTNWIEM